MTDSNQGPQFLKNYLTCIAELNQKQQSHYWWATDISSKNRFASNLAARLDDVAQGKTPRSSDPIFGFSATLKYVCRWLWHAARTTVRVAWIKIRLGKRIGQAIKESGDCYLLKSFVYPRSFKDDHSYQDAFLGALLPYIQRHQKVVVVVDIPSNFNQCVDSLATLNDTVTVVPWEYFLSFIDIWVYTIKALFYQPNKVDSSMLGDIDVTGLVNEYLAYGQAKIQPYQFFHYPAFKRLFKQLRVQRFLLTHESNPWERMCILAAREVASDIRIVGYQHNVVPQASANMFIAPDEWGKTPLPDEIITTGDEPKKVLQQYGAYPTDVIKTGCALRIEPFGEDDSPKKPIKRILVAMEGVDGAHVLARYAIEQLKDKLQYHVVFRTHPVLSWSYFENKYGCDLTPHAHFELSAGKTLKQDIQEADVVLYWGSTVGMESLGLGKPVVHIDNGALLSFDPLFCCDHLKWVVQEQTDFHAVLQGIDALSEEAFKEQLELARQYLKGYFYPVSDEHMRVFMAE